MNYLTLAFVFVLGYAAAVEDWGDSDFDDNIQKYDVTLVMFYAPWCGHCKKLKPEFDIAGDVLEANDPPVKLSKVDCTAEGKATCSKFGVSGYPTLKIFRGDPSSGAAEEYNGPREQDGIVKYMRSKAGPSSKDITSKADMVKFLENAEHSIVGFFSDESTDLAKKFKQVADQLSEDFRFAHTTAADVMEEQGHTDAVVLFQPKRLQNKFEASSVVYDGKAAVHAMKEFVKENIHGLAGHRTPGNSAQFKNPLVTVYYDVDYIKNTKGTNYWRNRVMKVAKKLADAGKKANFAVASADDFGHELSEFNVNYADKPVVAAKDSKEQKFVMDAEFSMDNLEKFVDDMLAGKLEPYLKSEAVPDNSNNAVKVAVAKNFNELVNDDSKDVLIEFYAPWCGHCKSLAPKYEELAEKLADEPEIAIVKMDATANDVPHPYKVSGFPTLFFAPRNHKDSPKKYEGGREVKDMLKYLAKESTNPMKGYNRQGKKQKSEL